MRTGVDAKGNDVFKSQKFSKVKMTATNEQLKATADAIGAILMYPIAHVEKIDNSELITA
jgi:hypothetical protein